MSAQGFDDLDAQRFGVEDVRLVWQGEERVGSLGSEEPARLVDGAHLGAQLREYVVGPGGDEVVAVRRVRTFVRVGARRTGARVRSRLVPPLARETVPALGAVPAGGGLREAPAAPVSAW